MPFGAFTMYRMLLRRPHTQVTVGIQGRAVGYPVRLEKKEDPFARGCGVPDSVNFREVKVGVTTTRVVNIYNQASTPCRFCFVIQVCATNAALFAEHLKDAIASNSPKHRALSV